jgi:hypothetical protein
MVLGRSASVVAAAAAAEAFAEAWGSCETIEEEERSVEATEFVSKSVIEGWPRAVILVVDGEIEVASDLGVVAVDVVMLEGEAVTVRAVRVAGTASLCPRQTLYADDALLSTAGQEAYIQRRATSPRLSPPVL